MLRSRKWRGVYRGAALRMEGGGRNGRRHLARPPWTGRRAVLCLKRIGSWLDAIGG